MKTFWCKTSKMEKPTSLNSVLKSFNPQRFDQLMRYLLVDWENLNEKKIAYKYPNIATEILSANQEVVINYFLRIEEGAEISFVNFDQLISFFTKIFESKNYSEFNFTRAGYVCKILNNLVLHKSGAFIRYLINQQYSLSAILNCCFSKSVSGLLLSIITLLPSAQQTPYGMGVNAQMFENKTDQTNAPQPDVLKETFENRLEVFSEMIRVCINSQSDIELAEIHANLANVIMIILNKDFPERINFMKVLLDAILIIVAQFAETFFSSSNNKLGNIFLVLLEVLLKDSPKDNLLASLKTTFLPHCIEIYYRLLQDYFKPENLKSLQTFSTPSFSREINRLNPKIYKILEAIIVTLKAQTTENFFDLNVVISGNFERYVFRFFDMFPFNNILHNQLKKYLMIILEKAPEMLVRKYFTDNPEFYQFLERITNHKFMDSVSGRKIKKGFVGHTLTLVKLLKEKPESITLNIFESFFKRPDLETFL